MKQSTKIIIAVLVIAVVALAAWYFLIKTKKKPVITTGRQTFKKDVPMQDDGSNQVKDVANGLDPDVKAYNSPGAFVIPIVMPTSSTMPSSVPNTGTIHNNADTSVLVPIGAPALNDNVLKTTEAATA